MTTEKIGEGSYGIVYRGKFTGSSEVSGVQVIKRNIIDNSVSFIGSIRELDSLITFRGHPNVINLTAVMFGLNSPSIGLSPLNRKDYKDDVIHFIFENATTNLVTLLTSEKLGYTEIRYFISDILVGLEYIHANGYIHRDIKTENLLVMPPNSVINRRHIKICDFGFAKPWCRTGNLTPQIVTSWYRSPDLCMGSMKYSYEIDSWSVGCIIFELLTQEAMCQNCKDDDMELLACCFSKIPKDCFNRRRLKKGGSPNLVEYPDTIVARGIPKNVFMETLKIRRPFEIECGTGSLDHLYNLIVDLMRVTPEDRILPTKALESKFFSPIKLEIDAIRMPYIQRLPVIKQTKYRIIDCLERKWVSSVIFLIYNSRMSLIWYKHRIIFQAISLMDRYLNDIDLKGSRGTKQEKQESEGKFHSKNGTILRFLVCLYISIKYFTSIEHVIPFEIFTIEQYRDPQYIKFAEEFERSLIEDIFKYKLYLPTPLELISETMGRSLTEDEICGILTKYGKLTSFEGTCERLASICEK